MDFLTKYDKGERHPALDATRRAYRFMQDFQFRSYDEIKDWQYKQLKQLVFHASKTIPMFEDLYNGKVDIQSLEEFEALPILNRDYLSHWDANKKMSMQVTEETRLRSRIKTSGTTLNPVEAFRSYRTEYWRELYPLSHHDRYSWL